MTLAWAAGGAGKQALGILSLCCEVLMCVDQAIFGVDAIDVVLVVIMGLDPKAFTPSLETLLLPFAVRIPSLRHQSAQSTACL